MAGGKDEVDDVGEGGRQLHHHLVPQLVRDGEGEGALGSSSASSASRTPRTPGTGAGGGWAGRRAGRSGPPARTR